MNDVEIVVSTLKGGGISNVVKAFARGLQNLNLFSRVTTLQDGFSDEFESSKVNCLEVGGHASNLLKVFVALRRILKYLKSRKSNDAKVHFCMDPSSFLVTYISNLNKGHVFISWCATPADLLVLSDRLIIRFMYSKAKVVIVPSEDMKRDLSLINPKANFRVVPNPLTFLEISCQWPKEYNAKKVSALYLGRFSAEKGVDLIPKLANRFSEISFVMVGDGPMKDSLEKEKKSMNLTNLEILNWGDPRAYFQEASLLILPSLYESFGLVIIESWIYGKKVVAAQVASGPRDLIGKHGGGSLVSQYEDLDEWGKLIKENLESQLADQFIADILETYSTESILNTWLDVAGVKPQVGGTF
jgi:glycosyltransferase involved in cell wall biosynthesis